MVDDIPVYAPDLMESEVNYPQNFFAELFKLESENFWFKSRNQLILWCLHKYFPNAKSLIEIGCGTGYVLSGIRQSFPQCNLSGTDLSIQGLKFAKLRVPSAQVLQLDARAIPFRNEFDVVAAFDVLEHIQEDDKVLQQIHAALKDSNGGLILTVPQHQFMWSAADDAAKHVRRYAMKDLVKLVEGAGFSIVYKNSFVSLIFPLMYMSRLLTKKQTLQDFDPMREFKIPRILDFFLHAILSFEQILRQCGMSFPFGGSIILIAKKL